MHGYFIWMVDIFKRDAAVFQDITDWQRKCLNETLEIFKN